MRVFIIKSVNLLIVAGILALYCINVHKVGEEKKAIAEKTDKKEVVSDSGNNIYFADDGIYEGSGDGFGGEIKVRLTVKDNKLEKVEILSAENETKDYLESAKKYLMIGSNIVVKWDNKCDERCYKKRKEKSNDSAF